MAVRPRSRERSIACFEPREQRVSSTPTETPADLRERAATARRLANDLSPRDAERLNQIAAELEAKAEALEQTQGNDNTGGETS